MDDRYAIGYKPIFTFNRDVYTDTAHADILAGVSGLIAVLAYGVEESGANERCLARAFDLVGGIVDALREDIEREAMRACGRLESGAAGDGE